MRRRGRDLRAGREPPDERTSSAVGQSSSPGRGSGGVAPGGEGAVDETVRRAETAGATVVTPPGRRPWGYAGAFADPDGHIWMITA
ncbi:VOC family protein [Streptomyces formicae]|uniref:VOC family protein n=1 Tax=Streptomyces formicae TaxID=1616117 RepID=A0ABY3WQG1_9ACTN|nr:VOC family protein [Streptomyces formicae]UNM14879.1 VOC family protein [Streptomyces formicae]